MPRTLSLIVRNVVFTVVVPGLGGAWVPWILTRDGHAATPASWEAVPVIAAGVASVRPRTSALASRRDKQADNCPGPERGQVVIR